MNAIRNILTLLTAILLFAATPAKAAHVADSLFQQANALYERSQFDSALMLYERIVETNLVADDLFYNMGNANFRMKRYPKAILYYAKSLKINPQNEDARFNLNLAKTFTIDKIETPYRLPIVVWFNSLYQTFSPKTWGIISIVSFAVALALALLFRFTTSKSTWIQAGVGAFTAFAIAVLSAWGGWTAQSKMNTAERAIIMQPVVSVKGSPDETAKDLFLLHAGTEVKIIEKIGEWYEVSIPNGHRGWLATSVLEEI